MHIVVGKISARYTGRGETELTPYNRIVIVKADGTVSIHGDKGFKPMNYMASSCEMTETETPEGLKTWTFETKKEKLVVTFHEIYDEINLDLGADDPGYSNKDGTEHQLQAWLTTNLSRLDPTLEFLAREHQTGAGPVDLLAQKPNGTLVAIEVKRLAPMNTVGQVLRYVDAIREQQPGEEVVGLIAAVEFKEKTRIIAAKKNVICLEIPPNWLEMAADETVEPLIVLPERTLFDSVDPAG